MDGLGLLVVEDVEVEDEDLEVEPPPPLLRIPVLHELLRGAVTTEGFVSEVCLG